MLRYEPVLALRHAMVMLSVKRANRMGQTTHEQAIDTAATSSPDALDPRKPRRRKGATRYIWAACGFIAFALAMIGVALPLLPTTPFLLLAALCFARSSQRIDDWFKSTRVYHEVLEGYVQKRSMTLKAKALVLVPVTALLGVAFAFMGRVPIGRIILVVVWLGHLIYFGLIVPTDRSE